MKTRSEILSSYAAVFLFLAAALYFTVTGAIQGYESLNGWKIGDWLINYQGGFVRRGFLGELIYRISTIMNYSPGLIVAYIQISLYLIFFIFSFLLLCRQNSLKAYWLLVFSPFLFYFQIFDVQGGYRKEIIFFAFLALLVWSSINLKERYFEILCYAIFAIFPFVILTHEMLAVFMPYLLIPFLHKFILTKKRLGYLAFLISLSVVAFIFCLIYSGTPSTIKSIQNSLSFIGYSPGFGAINWLDKDIAFAIDNLKQNVLKWDYYRIYVSVILLSALAYIPIAPKLFRLLNTKIKGVLFSVSLVASFLLLITLLDWGRIIYINLVSIFLISLLDHGEEPLYTRQMSWTFLGLLSVLYFSFWHIPHCCGYQPIVNSIELTHIEILLRRGLGD